MKIAIIIPARYGSTRFPGKPLAKIAGKTMLERVINLAQSAGKNYDDVDVFVTTEDQSIAQHAQEIGANCIITSKNCATGSDRCLQALQKCEEPYDFVINLQGDAPLTPARVLTDLIDYIHDHRDNVQVVTPVCALEWDCLDSLRERKKTTPFSGTTAIIDPHTHQAKWFSKTIIPAMRGESDLRRTEKLSPVYQHIGIYGFRSAILEKFVSLPQGYYETLEGLEQLRLLENNIPIHGVPVAISSRLINSGIDSPEDVAYAESFLDQYPGHFL